MGTWLLLSGYYLLLKKANCESSTERHGIQAVVTHAATVSSQRKSVMTTTGGKEKVQVAVRMRPPLPRETVGGKFTSCLGIGPTTDKGQTILVSGDDAPVHTEAR